MASTTEATTVSRFFHPTARTKIPGRLPPLKRFELPAQIESPTLTAIRSLYYHPGPYVTVNLTVHPGTGPAADSTQRRWEAVDRELEQRKTSPLVIEEIAQRVLSTPPAWAASVSVVAASDGTVVASHGPEPFFADMVVVDTLPYVVPLLTWSRRRGPHLIMTEYDLESLGSPGQGILGESGESHSGDRPTHLVLLGQPAATRPVAEMISTGSHRRFQVVAETRLIDAADLAAHQTSTTSGRADGGQPAVVHRSVQHLPGVDGDLDSVQRVLDRLQNGDVDVIVIPPDDTLDQRRLWVGPSATDLSLTKRRGHHHQARLVDAVARAALVTGLTVIVHAPDEGPDTRFVA